MATGLDIRLGKLFGDAGKAVVVACDHGMFDGPHAGMEDIPAMLERMGDGPDAVLRAAGRFRNNSNLIVCCPLASPPASIHWSEDNASYGQIPWL